jgi:hypothetical protein
VWVLVFSFFKYLTDSPLENNQVITYSKFYEKIKLFYPYLSSVYIEEIFLNLDNNNDGIIKLSDLDDFLTS